MRQFPLPMMRMLILALLSACGSSPVKTMQQDELSLKRGDFVSCGRESAAFGVTRFAATVPAGSVAEFNTGIALLHSFEYDEAEKAFAKVIDRSPDCAMAYWGVAMANFHPLWAPPDQSELAKGAAAVRLAKSKGPQTAREKAYIDAIALFYDSASILDHRSRVRKFESAMGKIYDSNPSDIDAAVFYALLLDAAADPKDKTYVRQKKAFAILSPVFSKQPLHPGVAHLIIHSCDYPALAAMGLDAARKYASIAPSSAHAQHMPSHIFTRLGDWNGCVNSNLAAAASAVCYGEQSGMKGHWGEELHALDYLVYAYLQQGDNQKAQQQMNYVLQMAAVGQQDFKTAHALAAIPARYALENHDWVSAAGLPFSAAFTNWQKFPWQQGIIRLARVLGNANTGRLAEASAELDSLDTLYKKQPQVPDKMNETALLRVQVQTGRAWLTYFSNATQGLSLMKEAAELEDAMEKHPVTPGEVLPARELYADMLLRSARPSEALVEYEKVLASHANRFNALYGAAVAGREAGETVKSKMYYKELLAVSVPGSARKQLNEARESLH